MKSIYVPTDFSPCGNFALDFTFTLAQEHHAVVHVVNGFSANTEIISSDFISPFQGAPATMSAEQINDFLNERIKYIKEKFAEIEKRANEFNVDVITYQLESSLFDELAEKAAELDCDLVVMGTHGSKGIEEALIGSNTQKFVRNSKIPVLVLKQPILANEIKNVAFFSTFSQEGEQLIYREYQKLFKNASFKTHLVLVNTPSHFLKTPAAQERIDQFLLGTQPENYQTHIYNDLSVEEGILNFAQNHNINLLVLGTHGYTGLKRLFRSSLTESIINHAKYPVLSFWLSKQG